MFRGKDVEEIQELKREGLSMRAISRLTGYSRKTIARYLLKPLGRPVCGPRAAAASKLEPFKPYLKERLQTGVWNAQVLLRELRERSYAGSIVVRINRHLRQIPIVIDALCRLDKETTCSVEGWGGNRWQFCNRTGHSTTVLLAPARKRTFGSC